MDTYTRDARICKDMTKKYGTSYYIATYFFAKELREATWILYAFVRYPDEIVDTEEKDSARAKEKLTAWKEEWVRAYNGDTDVHPVLRANSVLWKEKRIPFEYSEIFLNAMFADTEKNRYETYAELEEYMMGSATVVGYMMSHLIGYTGDALPHARSLAEAFQMTNFLRDVVEDLERGRIYLPKEDMERFEVTEEMLRTGTSNSHLLTLLDFQIERTEKLYTHGLAGIPMLARGGQRAVRMAYGLYKGIFEKIRKNPARIFSGRTRVSTLEKLRIIITHLF